MRPHARLDADMELGFRIEDLPTFSHIDAEKYVRKSEPSYKRDLRMVLPPDTLSILPTTVQRKNFEQPPKSPPLELIMNLLDSVDLIQSHVFGVRLLLDTDVGSSQRLVIELNATTGRHDLSDHPPQTDVTQVVDLVIGY